YDQNRTGDTISRMTNDTGVVKTLISEHLSNLLTGGISIVGSLIVLFVLDWKLTLALFPLSNQIVITFVYLYSLFHILFFLYLKIS
ncbi:ABC transporter transmembrane domain-containing protein, partial [Bacillus sp. D-CC]